MSRGRAARAALAGMLAIACARATPAAGLEPVANAFRQMEPIADIRLRAESVDQDGMPREADAVTLRGRVGLETGKAWDTALLAEVDLIWPLGTDYDSTVNGRTLYPVVADPEGYELNRLQLVNTSLPGTRITLGRQRITLDDHRFVGNVGWRQNEQTFDAARIVNETLPGITVDVAWIRQVNRVFGRRSAVGRFQGDSVLANVGWQTPAGRLTGFAYRLDFDEAPAESSQTVGLRLAGTRPVRSAEVTYLFSYATQRDRGGNPLDYSVDYYAMELTGAFRRLSLGAGAERLEGDGVKGFSTPLATLHRFQGWADKFLATPPDGLDDRYVTAGYEIGDLGALQRLSVSAVYHVFEAERVGLDYGSEIDLQVQAAWRRFSGLLKYSDYRADGFASDTRKVWLQVDFVL